MANLSLTARVRVPPLFQLASDYRSINRPCVLYARSSLFAKGESDNNTEGKTKIEWFSGSYMMLGFKNVITETDAYSEFYLVRNVQSSKKTEEEEEEKEEKDEISTFDRVVGDLKQLGSDALDTTFDAVNNILY